MWELFSLGSVPYPGMDANDELFRKIRDGYRMDKPQFANREIFDVMLDCWRFSPETRPLFNDLESLFGSMVDQIVSDVSIELLQSPFGHSLHFNFIV